VRRISRERFKTTRYPMRSFRTGMFMSSARPVSLSMICLTAGSCQSNRASLLKSLHEPRVAQCQKLRARGLGGKDLKPPRPFPQACQSGSCSHNFPTFSPRDLTLHLFSLVIPSYCINRCLDTRFRAASLYMAVFPCCSSN
jgi:hypothetical protein